MNNSNSTKVCEFSISGMDCADCAQKIETITAKQSGIADVSVNLLSGKMKVEFDPTAITKDQIAEAVNRLGYRVGEKKQSGEITLRIKGMDCAEEIEALRRTV